MYLLLMENVKFFIRQGVHYAGIRLEFDSYCRVASNSLEACETGRAFDVVIFWLQDGPCNALTGILTSHRSLPHML
jgi:hypothetical protein